MKKKIEDALKTEYASLGLSDKTISRLATYLEGSVEKEEDIATAVKRDDVVLIAKSIQGEIDGIQKAKKKAEEDLADYKAKHPEKKNDDDEGGNKPPTKQSDDPDVAKLVAEAVAAAIAPLQKSLDDYKSLNSAKEAKTLAKETFFGNKWTEKFTDEAEDAWERAVELNEAQGGKMTAEELASKANGYFKKAVSRKGTDVSKPFDSDGDKDDIPDFSKMAKHLEDAGLLQPEQ